MVQDACFVFVAFTGEETGLHGAKALVKALHKSRIRPSAMLNLDMVGRMRNDEVYVFGQRSFGSDAALIPNLCRGAGLKCMDGAIDTVLSDHLVFRAEKIPTLHFFTGSHSDKHKFTDTADKLDSAGGAKVAWLAAQIALATARGAKVP
jgi:Zn-dependent M28 family amino/carboxypeptidase